MWYNRRNFNEVKRELMKIKFNADVHYHGKHCVKCGNDVRYIKKRSCANCNVKNRRKWKIENPEKVKEYNAIYRAENKEKYYEWRENNPEKIKAIKHKRYAREKNSEGSFTGDEWKELLEKYGNKCLVCGDTELIEADHIIPISKGGCSYIFNIQPLCRYHNTQKKDKYIDYRPESNGYPRIYEKEIDSIFVENCP